MHNITAVGSVLGLDVGYSPTRKSNAICRIDWTETEISWTIERFRAIPEERYATIKQNITGQLILAAALDGPIRNGFDLIGRYRTAERLLTRRLQPRIGKPGQASAPVGKSLNAATNICAQILKSTANISQAKHAVKIDALAIVEAFPTSFLGLMIEAPETLGATRGNRSNVFFESALKKNQLHNLINLLLPARRTANSPETITNHDERSAFICALTALCVAANNYTAVGDDDGWIILPPKLLIQEWALNELLENSKEAPESFYSST